MDAIDHGQAQKASATDSADFLRAALPLIAGGNKFFLGTMEEQHGFDWIVPPDEPVEKTDDKTRPPARLHFAESPLRESSANGKLAAGETFSIVSPLRIIPPSSTRHSIPRRPRISRRNPGRIFSS